MSKRFKTTEISGFDYLDMSWYRTALDDDNLWDMDYSIARVFNNPTYSNNISLDIRLQIENPKIKVMPFIATTHEEDNVINSKYIVDELVKTMELLITDEKERRLSYIALSWYLITTNLLADSLPAEIPSKLMAFITELYDVAREENSNKVNRWLLNRVCGSRVKADYSVKLLECVLNKFRGDDDE